MSKRIFTLMVVAVLILSANSYSLTNGPVMPEYSSFEPVDVSDLVNMPTGDFTYTVPLGAVKGAGDVDYPVVLSYHAGIQNEQEASWVGLGWTLNVGAINRALRGTADDAKGDVVTSFMANSGESGFNVNVGGGWLAVAATVGWNEKGFVGVTSMELGWNLGIASIGLSYQVQQNALTVSAGVGIGKGQNMNAGVTVGFTVDIDDYTDVTPFLSVSLKAGPAGFSLTAANDKVTTNMSMARASASTMSHSKGGLSQWSSSCGLTVPLPFGIRFDVSASTWGWKYDQLILGKLFGYLYQSKEFKPVVLTEDELLVNILTGLNASSGWEYLLAEDEQAYRGIAAATGDVKLNFDKLEIVSRQKFIDNKEKCMLLPKAALSSADMFNVTGQGISGAFRAFVYEAQRSFSHINDKYDHIPARIKDEGGNEILDPDGYFNTSDQVISGEYNRGIVFKMVGEAMLNLIDEHMDNPGSDFDFDDSPIYNVYENIDESSVTNTAKRVSGTRIDPVFGYNSWLGSKLSGFIVTDMQGIKYYYLLPLYSHRKVAYTSNKDKKPANHKFGGDNFEYSYREEVEPYALTWLLTAITGPDYVKKVCLNQLDGNNKTNDAKEILRPHQGDWGYWVSFRYEYGRPVEVETINQNKEIGLPEESVGEIIEDANGETVWQEAPRVKMAMYRWRQPYEGFIETETTVGKKKTMYSTTMGEKDVTFLKSIETSSEIAYFRTSPRLDGVGSKKPYIEQEKFLIDADNITKCYPSHYPDWRGADWKRIFTDVVPGRRDGIDAIITDNWQDECMKVYIPVEDFRVPPNFKENTLLFTLHFNVPLNGKRNDKTRFCKYQERRLKIYYNKNGWNYNVDGECTGFDDLDAARELWQLGSYLDNVKYRVYEGAFNRLKYTFNSKKHDVYCVPVAKCFYWTQTEHNGEPCYVFYIINAQAWRSFQQLTHTDYWYYVTGLKIMSHDEGGMIFKYKNKRYYLRPVDIMISKGKVTHPKFGLLHSTPSTDNSQYAETPYLKKLDEIAWYSKAAYPYINPFIDPGDRGVAGNQPWEGKVLYPQSYKRVKFIYNYELAKNTPNSYSAPGKLGGGGRLTLKQVEFQGGLEDKSVSMPPYMFSYQGADVEYTEFKEKDPWGFRYTTSEKNYDLLLTSPNIGVNWNLSEVLLPTCGKLKMEYERDRINSVAATLYLMRRYFEYEYRRGATYEEAMKPSREQNTPATTEKSPQPNFPNSAVGYDNRTIQFKGPYWDNFSIRSPIETHPVTGDWMVYAGQWVTKDDYIILRYSVDAGPNLPPEIRLFYLFRVKGIDPDPVGGGYYYRIDGRLEDYGIENPNSPLGSAIALYKTKLYCGDLRTKKITSSTLSGTKSIIYEYPDGTVEIMPDEAIAWPWNTPYMHIPSGIWYGSSRYTGQNNIIAKAPFSSDPAQNYNTGNTSVIYPEVQVHSVTDKHKDYQTPYGYTKYHFYTFGDSVLVDGKWQDIITTETDVGKFYLPDDQKDITLIKVTDRSAIVGQIKKIETYNKDNRIIETKEKFYRFSEELKNIHNGSFSQTFDGDSKPLGLVRERSVRLEDSEEAPITEEAPIPESVTDVIISHPFIVEERSTKDNVVTTVKHGFFNAMDGAAMAQKTHKPNQIDPAIKDTKLSLKIPYNYIAPGIPGNDKKSILQKKNIYSLGGANILSSMDVDFEAIGACIQNILDNSSSFVEASAKSWDLTEFYTPYNYTYLDDDEQTVYVWLIPEYQRRFNSKNDYAWFGFKTGNTFTFPELFATGTNYKEQWRRIDSIIDVDLYTRPVCAMNGENEVASVVYHPYSKGVLAFINNAHYSNVGIFTGDYDDFLKVYDYEDEGDNTSVFNIEDEYFDITNGWEKGIVKDLDAGSKIRKPDGVLVVQDKITHFGKRCVRIKDTWGPAKTFDAISKDKDYTFSAWIFSNLASAQTVNLRATIIKDGAADQIVVDQQFSSVPDKWTFIETEITRDLLAGMSSSDKLEIAIGSDNNVEFFADDIRFFPSDALVKTFYYDQNLMVPVTFVDENNNAQYFKYDGFGKVIEKGIKSNP